VADWGAALQRAAVTVSPYGEPSTPAHCVRRLVRKEGRSRGLYLRVRISLGWFCVAALEVVCVLLAIAILVVVL